MVELDRHVLAFLQTEASPHSRLHHLIRVEDRLVVRTRDAELDSLSRCQPRCVVNLNKGAAGRDVACPGRGISIGLSGSELDGAIVLDPWVLASFVHGLEVRWTASASRGRGGMSLLSGGPRAAFDLI